MMPVEAPIRLDAGDHVVHFYDRDDDLLDVVIGYLSAAVTDGDAVVVIATPAHLSAIEAALEAAGGGSSARDGDRLVLLDAADSLSGFMHAGMPDPARFDAVVGETVRRLAATGRPVRAYGEMVAVLWAAGQRAAAVALERLWNGLGAATPFSLFCSYPSHLADDDRSDVFAEVCGLHSRVISGTPRRPVLGEVRRFTRSTNAPRMARRFVGQTLLAWGFPELVDDAAVVVTELAANAVVHAGSDITVSMTSLNGSVRIAVADRSSILPVPRLSGPDALGGRGLALVDQLAACWGHAVTDDGKVVWAELAVAVRAAR